MSVEEKLEQCRFNLRQIIHYNPEPYYVNHFLIEFIKSVTSVYDEILQEANRDFGLFVEGRCSLKKFESKSRMKDDKLALKYFSWFNENYEQEHKAQYPNFVKKMICFYEQKKHLPKIKIKIIANQRYKDDISQEILVGLKNGKFRSKEIVETEIKRQTPVFLEVINNKRKNKDEPKVSTNQIIASAFMKVEKSEDFEIINVCEAYLSVLTRFIDESRNKIRKLTQREKR